MKKSIYILILVIISNFDYCYSQINLEKLNSDVKFNMRDLVELRLQILSAQLSSRSYYIPDMGFLDYPVAISLKSDNIVHFCIWGDINENYNDSELLGAIQGYMSIVETAIVDLMASKFSNLEFDKHNSLMGYWHNAYDPDPIAILENDNIIILNN